MNPAKFLYLLRLSFFRILNLSTFKLFASGTSLVIASDPASIVPKSTPLNEIEEYRLQMQYATNALMAESKQLLGTKVSRKS